MNTASKRKNKSEPLFKGDKSKAKKSIVRDTENNRYKVVSDGKGDYTVARMDGKPIKTVEERNKAIDLFNNGDAYTKESKSLTKKEQDLKGIVLEKAMDNYNGEVTLNEAI